MKIKFEGCIRLWVSEDKDWLCFNHAVQSAMNGEYVNMMLDDDDYEDDGWYESRCTICRQAEDERMQIQRAEIEARDREYEAKRQAAILKLSKAKEMLDSLSEEDRHAVLSTPISPEEIDAWLEDTNEDQ